MATLDRPKLRPLSARRLDHEGQTFVALDDPMGVAPGPILVPVEGFQLVVRHFDGRSTLEDIQARIQRETGQVVPGDALRGLVDRLDRAMVLDGPTFAAFFDGYRTERVRPAALAGRSYAGTEAALRSQIDGYYADPRGAGPPVPGRPAPRDGERLRGVLSPHIDFSRGGPTYTWAFRELIERTDADVFVILGVAHQYSRNRFALTRKDFQTPFGTAYTDRAYVDRLAALAGDHLFEDELAHRTEHSVEFQVVFLQHLLGARAEAVTIVPILVGSFHDLMLTGLDPIHDPEVARFVSALRAAEAACGRRVAYIGGIDLCHVGPEFGDPDRLDAGTLDRVRRFDADLLDRAAAGDPAGWFHVAAEISNAYRVCGLAATYTLLHAIGPVRGRLLRYDQAVNPERTCGVTFASMALDGVPEGPSRA